MNSQPSSSSTRSMVRVGGGAPATMMRTRSRPGISPSHVARGVERGRDDRRRRAHQRDAVPLDAAQDLGAVDLAQHDVPAADAGHAERHAPAVGVEHRQRVQVDVAVADRGVQAEHRGVEPDVAVGQLHALGARRRAGGVVDRRGGRLVRLVPRPRLGVGQVEVVVVAEHELVRDVEGVEQVFLLRVAVDDLGAAVLDDVGDLGRAEPEVDRHQDPAPAARRRRTTVSSRAEFCEMTATRPPTGTPSRSSRAACARAFAASRR